MLEIRNIYAHLEMGSLGVYLDKVDQLQVDIKVESCYGLQKLKTIFDTKLK